MLDESGQVPEESLSVAVIGMSGRFPGAADLGQFWENLRRGVESVSFFSDEELIESGVDPAVLSDPNYVKAAPILSDADKFDAAFFGYSPREAQMMDPQQRVFLECAWEAIEHAGYDPAAYAGDIGVYAGSAMNTYLLFSGLLPHFTREYLLTLISSDKDFLATRVSYKLDLRGPSVAVQTACSTSLVAVHMACQSLLGGECDMALAGGVCVRVPLKSGHFFQPGSVFTPDGHCRPFDAGARGTLFGSGAGVVALKRLADALADADHIHAVILGSAVNNDGAAKADYTAPSVERQAGVVAEALAAAGVSAETIGYVEAHGTGTTLGDPIEVAALTRAFRAHTARRGYCALGSVKGNVGHLDAAAGVAGLLKAVLALGRGVIPPTAHYERANPELGLEQSPFYVSGVAEAWGGAGPRRAGVSALGVGGTNAHVVLEQAPAAAAGGEVGRGWELVVVSARGRGALGEAAARLAGHLRGGGAELADVAFTLQAGRRRFEHRLAAVCRDTLDAIRVLETPDEKRVLTSHQKPISRDVVFMFTGQGTQYVNMGLELYRTEPEFRRRIDLCSDLLRPHLPRDLRGVLFPDEKDVESAAERLDQTAVAQPALFSVQYALAGLWKSWGFNPHAFIGHSVGEYMAAHLAGVFSLEDALSLVAVRGQLIQRLPGGSMLAVPLAENEVRPLLDERLSLAAVNGPSLCVVSGETEAIEGLEEQLSTRNLSCRRLRTSHAFHSRMVEPVLDEFTERVRSVGPRPPEVPFISCVTGTWIRPEEATDPGYWRRQARRTVRFAEGIQELMKEPNQILLELGPGHTLCTMARQYPELAADQVVLPSLRHPLDRQSDVPFILNTLGRLWLAGASVDWRGFRAHERRRRVPLPTYPFQRQKFWIEPAEDSVVTATPSGGNGTRRRGRSSQSGPAAPPGRTVRDPETRSDPTLHSPPEPRPRHGEEEPVEDGRVAPRSPVEAVVMGVWQEVLGVPRIGVHDNFYELGGHSLLIPKIISLLNRAFQVELPQLTLIGAPTVAELSGCIEAVYRVEQGVAARPPQ